MDGSPLPTKFDHGLRDQALVIDLGSPRRLLSSAPWRGGLITSRWWVNKHVHLAFRPGDVEGWIGGMLSELKLPPGETTCCLTAAYVERFGSASACGEGVGVHALVTAGLSNLSSAGLTPAWNREVERPSHHTINACLLVEAALSDAALVELVQIVTEVKARVLSPRKTTEGFQATGTSTDTVTVIELGGPLSAYAGAVTPVGNAAAKAFGQAFLCALSRNGQA